MLNVEVLLDAPRDHDVQSWLMGQMGEFERVRREAASASLDAKFDLFARRCGFLQDTSILHSRPVAPIGAIVAVAPQ